MINWKLRWKNKTTLLAITTAVIALVYQVLGCLALLPAYPILIERFAMISRSDVQAGAA